VILSRDDAQAMKVREGGRVQISTQTGASVVRVRTDAGIASGVAVLPTEYPGVIRTLAGSGEGGELPTAPVAGAIKPAETR